MVGQEKTPPHPRSAQESWLLFRQINLKALFMMMETSMSESQPCVALLVNISMKPVISL